MSFRSDPLRYAAMHNPHVFFDTLTSADLHARGTASRQEYRVVYADHVAAVPRRLRTKLRNAIEEVQEFMHPWFLESTCPWKICYLTPGNREDSMPHTLFGYILLPLEWEQWSFRRLKQVLVHERIHVLQHFPPFRKQVLNPWMRQFTRISRHPLHRANPDLDGAAYSGFGIKYASSTPLSPSDIASGQSVEHEHPFEWMAYEYAKQYK